MGQGNFNVKMPDTDSNDEIGIVTRTFNQMVGSLEEYVAKVKEGAEKEQGAFGAGAPNGKPPEGSPP